MPDDGWAPRARLQGTRSLRAKVAGQRISCRLFGSGRPGGPWRRVFLTDYSTRTLHVHCFTRGVVDIGVHAWRGREKGDHMLRRHDGVFDRPAMLCESIEPHELGESDEMDVTRMLDSP